MRTSRQVNGTQEVIIGGGDTGWGCPNQTDESPYMLPGMPVVLEGHTGGIDVTPADEIVRDALADLEGEHPGILKAVADMAMSAALNELGQAYTNPHVRNTTASGINYALGLKPMPTPEGGN